MVEAMNRAVSWLAVWGGSPRRQLRVSAGALLWAFALSVWAHRTDELLQASLITIEPEAVQLELNLTPGVESLPSVLAVLDSDHDGRISSAEGETYADRVRSDLRLQLDGRALSLRGAGCQLPTLEDLRAGVGTLRLIVRAELPSLASGPHEVQYENRHRPEQSVYLVNAVVPRSPAVQVTGQARSANQSETRIGFTLTAAQTNAPVTTPRGEHYWITWSGLVLFLAGVVGALGAAWYRR